MLILLVGLLFIAIGLFLVFRARSIGREFKSSGNWQSAPGRIESSEVVTHEQPREAGEKQQFRYIPTVTYSYAVAGAPFQAKRIGFNTSTLIHQNAAVEKLQPYAVGASVNVYYDPQNPSLAVLERSKPRGTIMMTLIGLLFAGLGSLAALIGLAMSAGKH